MASVKNQKPIRKHTFFFRIILLLNFITICGLLAAYLSNYIPPSMFSWFAFAGLIYPFFLISNLIFVVFWLITRKRYALISIIAILIGWNQLGRFIRIFPKNEKPKTESVKVMTYNIQNFFNKNISSTKYIENFKNREKIIDFIEAQNADIICLQEMFFDREDIHVYPEKLGNTLGCKHYYYENYFDNQSKKIDAIATFSKYKIIDTGHFTFDNKSIGIFTDLLIKDDTLRVYNLHLASIQFKKEDYEFVSDIAKNTDQQNFKIKFRKILSKLNEAFIKRSRQVDIITEHLKTCEYPVMICGDFNDTPCSYTYQQIAGPLKDSFIESGKGVAETFAGDDFPSLRIDYILHSESISTASFQRHRINLSDHFPVTTEVIFVK
jgi:endonuclease/exonuclease/phosphatase family metal-dependent hydrolase